MRPVFILAAIAVLAILAIGFLVPFSEPDQLPHVLTIEEGDLLYTYHMLSGTEALFDVREDPNHVRNLCRVRTDDAVALRRELSTRFGVVDLRELREKSRDPLMERLQSLGYLR